MQFRGERGASRPGAEPVAPLKPQSGEASCCSRVCFVCTFLQFNQNEIVLPFNTFLCCCHSGPAGGLLIPGAFGGVPQQLLSASPADVPASRLGLPLQLPRGVRSGHSRHVWLQPVRLPSIHCPLLSFSGHGAAAGPRPQQPRPLPLCLCSNVHLSVLLQERLGQSQGFCQQSAARAAHGLPASVCHGVAVCQRDAPGRGLRRLPAQPAAPRTVPLPIKSHTF